MHHVTQIKIDSAEMAALAARVKAGDRKAGDKLCASLYHYVCRLAFGFSKGKRGILDDLIQEGLFGIVQACNTFDADRASFITHADRWIRARMMKYRMSTDRIVKIGNTRDERKLWGAIPRVRAECEAEGIAFTPEILSEKTGVNLDKCIRFMRLVAKSDLSLDAPWGSDDKTTGHDHVCGSEAVDSDAGHGIQIEGMRAEIQEFAATLNPRDAEIPFTRILAPEGQEKLLVEIGNDHGVTRERIRQIEAKILSKLRAFLVDRGIVDPKEEIQAAG